MAVKPSLVWLVQHGVVEFHATREAIVAKGFEPMPAKLYAHILVPTDGSEPSGKAIAEAIRLAAVLGSKLTFLTVTQPYSSLGDFGHAFQGMPEDMRRQALGYLKADAQKILQQAAAAAASAGVAADVLSIEAEHAPTAIVDAVGQTSADLILMGSHGRSGVNALLLGSVTQRVLAGAAVPVLVCR
jgi:nucleotide-binding universal stress UspA family protein